jgi:hypothetical protein
MMRITTRLTVFHYVDCYLLPYHDLLLQRNPDFRNCDIVLAVW